MVTGPCRIERAGIKDLPLMLELWRCIPGLGVGSGDEEESLRLFMERNPSTCLLLKDGERLLGTVLGGFDGRRGYIYHLAVHPDCQGQGYGRELLKEVLYELRKLGAPKIHLFAFNDNQLAAGFYQNQGWEWRRDIQVFSWDMDKWKTENGKRNDGGDGVVDKAFFMRTLLRLSRPVLSPTSLSQ